MWSWSRASIIYLIAGFIVLAWLLTYLAGGSRSALPHAFYLPIVLAAFRFRWAGAALSALVAGIAVGPLMPLQVATNTAQAPHNWVARMVAFLVIGTLVAWLSSQSRTSIRQALRDGRLAADLHAALAADTLALHYQPIVDLRTGLTVGFEALARWDRPGHGPVSPSEFIPAAERLGVVAALDAYALRRAAREAATWPTGPHQDGAPYVAVNVSGHTFSSGALPETVASTLAEAGLPAERLHVELTETAILSDPDAARAALHQLRTMGVGVSIDDFGTGQSSLSYLHELPVDTVKIDRSFIAGLDANRRAAALAEGVVGIATVLGASTIAEGVEQPHQLQALAALGCSHAQGYLLARPMPAHEVAAAIQHPHPVLPRSSTRR